MRKRNIDIVEYTQLLQTLNEFVAAVTYRLNMVDRRLDNISRRINNLESVHGR